MEMVPRSPAPPKDGHGYPFWTDRGCDNHAVGLHSPQLARREIHNHGDFAPDQFFWLVILRNARANLPDLRADVHGEF